MYNAETANWYNVETCYVVIWLYMFKQSVKSQHILLGKGLLFCKERVKYFLVLNAEFWYGRDIPKSRRNKNQKISNSSTVCNVTSDFQTLLILGEVNHMWNISRVRKRCICVVMVTIKTLSKRFWEHSLRFTFYTALSTSF